MAGPAAARLVALALGLATIVTAGAAAAADRYPFWARNFAYLPALSGTSGTAPLTTTAQWSSHFAMLVDTSRWADYPWYEHISIDWGDGTRERLPTSSLSPVAGAPDQLARKTWPAQSLSHSYQAQGSYTVRLIYEKSGIADADVLLTVQVAAPTTASSPSKPGKGPKPKAASAMLAASADTEPAGDTMLMGVAAAPAADDDATAGGCGAAPCGRTRTYDIRYMAFVPANHIKLGDAAASCRAADGALAPLVFAGDDRGFDADAHQRQRYRVLQRAIVTERTGADGDHVLTLAASETMVQPDLAIRAGRGPGSALGQGGRLDLEAVAADRRLGDCELLHARAGAAQRSWQDPQVIGRTGQALTLAFRGSLRHGLAPGLVPDTAWDLTVTLDVSGKAPRVTAQGRHAGFPAYELYVNDRPLARYAPLRKRKLPVASLDAADPAWQKLPLQPVKASVILRD